MNKGYQSNDLVLEIDKKTTEKNQSKNKMARVVPAFALDREIVGKSIFKKRNK